MSGAVTPCSGHNLEAALKTSHTAANPNRRFYCCPLDRSDPQRCSFFLWADQPLATPPSSPKKRSPAEHSTPEAKQKRRKLIEEALPPSSLPSTSPLDDDRSHLFTPPPTSSRHEYVSRDSSPTPLPQDKGKGRAHDFTSSPDPIESTVDDTVSRELANITSTLADLGPQVQLLERQKSAGDKNNEHRSSMIEALRQENQELKDVVATLTIENERLKQNLS